MKRRFARKAAVLAVSAVFPIVAFTAGDKPADKQADKPATSAGDSTMSSPARSSDSTPQTTPQTLPRVTDAAPQNDRVRMKQWSNDRESLESALRAGTGKGRTFYRQELERLGYRITAVNKDTPEELEYEVVKGQNSYEIQLDFDKSGTAAKEVDVATNLWKADSTEKALKDSSYQYEYPKQVGPEAAAYSDRARMKGWTSEKEQLEKSLMVGQSKDYYRGELTKRGYQVTSVNQAQPDYVEYEVVKGDNSYEVQVDFDKSTGKSTKVDVTANLWEDQATDRVLDRKEARAKQ